MFYQFSSHFDGLVASNLNLCQFLLSISSKFQMKSDNIFAGFLLENWSQISMIEAQSGSGGTSRCLENLEEQTISVNVLVHVICKFQLHERVATIFKLEHFVFLDVL